MLLFARAVYNCTVLLVCSNGGKHSRGRGLARRRVVARRAHRAAPPGSHPRATPRGQHTHTQTEQEVVDCAHKQQQQRPHISLAARARAPDRVLILCAWEPAGGARVAALLCRPIGVTRPRSYVPHICAVRRSSLQLFCTSARTHFGPQLLVFHCLFALAFSCARAAAAVAADILASAGARRDVKSEQEFL